MSSLAKDIPAGSRSGEDTLERTRSSRYAVMVDGDVAEATVTDTTVVEQPHEDGTTAPPQRPGKPKIRHD